MLGTEREYLAICANRHRSYARLRLLDLAQEPVAVCPRCGADAWCVPLDPPGEDLPGNPARWRVEHPEADG
jgi:hypothetical protein